MNTKLSLATILIGIFLMVMSVAWSGLFPPSRTWTPEKSKQLAEIGSRTNMLKFAIVEAKHNPSMQRGQNPAEIQRQYDAALAEYDVLHQEFLNATEQPQQISALLRWAGIALIIFSALFTYLARGG